MKISDTKISVILPVYNGGDYLPKAIQSILDQDFYNFELIIIDDGSTDSSLNVIKRFAKKDTRIKYVSRENRGLVESLNEAISLASSDLIARQDADDISMRNRLGVQFDFMINNPQTILLGSSIKTIDKNGSYLNTHKVLVGNNEIKHELIVRSPFAHGSVMFRKKAFINAGGYDSDEWPAEDYGLWVRMAKNGYFANIDEPLYEYMENFVGISQSNKEHQLSKKIEIQESAWKKRSSLFKSPFDTFAYRNLEMGEYRIERICHNLYYTMFKSLRHFKIIYLFRLILLLITDKILLRKTVRLALIKLKLKHV